MANHKLAGFADEASTEIEKQIEVTKKLGWSGIEIRTVKSGTKNSHFDDLADDEFYRYADMIAEAGIQIISYGTQIANWSRKITSDFKLDTDELKRIAPRMRKTGTAIARIMSYPNDALSNDAWGKEAIKRIKELAVIAEANGIMLCHENCSGFASQSAANTLRMIEEVNSKALKLIFDTGNFWEAGYSSLAFYKAVKEHVVHVHIKDYKKDPLAEKGWNAVFAGEGAGEVKEVLAELKRDGYNGWYSIEPHLAAVAHEGKAAAGGDSFELYLKYGRSVEQLLN
ncbi:MAG: sugar phosphate isomerase/epimerase [Fibrobacteres bacterium]|nr:sugar phosphate isomerase/epimerase [Fibrobacterota bacterium]